MRRRGFLVMLGLAPAFVATPAVEASRPDYWRVVDKHGMIIVEKLTFDQAIENAAELNAERPWAGCRPAKLVA